MSTIPDRSGDLYRIIVIVGDQVDGKVLSVGSGWVHRHRRGSAHSIRPGIMIEMLVITDVSQQTQKL